MKIHRPLDYAEHIIQAGMCIKNIQKNMNDGHYDTAAFMALQLKLTATLLEQSINKEKLAKDLSEF